ncbi:MAG: DNA polymerase III subunit [Dehalococcoidia bacterium]|nr:DNA polymerase III subunit [Dehalococcoidia bacterium]
MWQTAGQDRIINYLNDSIQRNSLAHAYLFVGPAHIGKMTLAIDLARVLNCPDHDHPCGTCHTCQRIGEGKYPDVIIINKNSGKDSKDRRKATEISIDTIREFLQKGSSLPPYEGKFKTFIIDDADLMSVEAANCLLKTLEEPPQHVVIILLTAAEKALLPTVISRCQRLELKPVALTETEERLSLKEGIHIEKIKLLSRLSGGCLGWALSATEDESFLKGRELRLDEFASLITRNWDERLSYIQQLPSDRSNIEEILKLWLSYCRDVMLIKYNCDGAISNLDRITDLKHWASMLTIFEIKEFISSLNESLSYLSYNANLHLLLEVLMLDMPKKEKRAEYVLNSSSPGY